MSTIKNLFSYLYKRFKNSPARIYFRRKILSQFLDFITMPFRWLLFAIISFLLQSRKFNAEFVEYELEKQLKGKKNIFYPRTNWLQQAWDEFFTANDFLQSQKKINELTSSLDTLSVEVASRSFYTHAIRHFEGIFLLSANLPVDLLEDHCLFPLDKKERNQLIATCKSFTNKFIFPMKLERTIETAQFLTQGGISYFPPEAQKLIVNKDVIDGGGFAGDTALIFADLQTRNVHAFEPNPDTIEEMKKVIDKNRKILGDNASKIVPVPFALGSTNGNMKLYSYGGCDTATTVHGYKSAKEYNVPVTSIDDYVQENSLNIGLIKLDVEGAESGVIEGAINTIKTQKPLLIISIYHTPKDFFGIRPRLENLNLGYRFLIRHISTKLATAEITLLGYPE
ncbi:MAG: FkbM family methyltransferase [Planctomycetaceae bacterium]|jgi:FkbM family methyltransferase|nr:FkbM family methyltransferase [Planctomycetaceae bacterium]